MAGYRELELYIGPFAEWKGQKNVSAVKLVCNGNSTSLRIDASVSKSIRTLENTARITLYNLSKEARDVLRKKNISVRLYAGEENKEKELVYAGGVLSAISFRQGPNIITKLSCRTGVGPSVRSTAAVSYTYETKVQDIVKSLAEKFPGVVVDPTNIKIDGSIGYAGWSFVGMTKDGLNKLAKQFGFSWTIQDGTFVAIKDGTAKKGRLLLDKSNGLRKVSPRLIGPMEVQEGVDIQATYNPGVNPGSSIRYKSWFDDKIHSFNVYSVDYELAPKTGNWEMNISSFSGMNIAGSGTWTGGNWVG